MPTSPAAIALPLRQRLALAAICVTGLALFQPFWTLDAQVRAGAAVLLAIGLWTTGWLPPWLTALVFFTLCMAGKVAPAADVFAGFASSAVWLVFSGAVLGEAIRHTGLGERLADRLAPVLTRSYPRAVAGVTLFAAAMLFIMPSAMGRTMLLLPILAALADRLGYRPGSKGRIGLILGGLFGTYLPATAVLPANIPNNVLAGSMESILGLVPSYGPYFLLHFPILGALRLGLLIALLAVLYRDAPQAAAAAPPQTAPGPTTAAQRRLGLVLALAVVLWSSDGWHHIPAAWTGMLAALVCLFPGSGLLPGNAFGSLRFEAIFYVAGIVSLGAVADHSGLGASVARLAIAALPFSPEAPGLAFGLLSGLSTLVGLAVTLPGVPPVMTPLTADLAAAVGWSPMAVAMTQVVAFSSVILPYQAPPLVVAIQSGYLPGRDVTRLCLLTAAITIIALWPLDYWWWRVLGLIG
ncbi:sodium:sulfate symporter [Desulfovibrio aerotolerans]|uniref:Sodium:sulfate symporter n=1 Tax=Solidesulfovibrio aerotolerans TaxID=295255 RepID=A0A7C9IKP2_9BACT|nr:SLC13 family permease [Solidesulfovibrio aerotolerans]MYL82346.1 sodium:sulfate symporter [Solidesulfovibrio aerotolerans]